MVVAVEVMEVALVVGGRDFGSSAVGGGGGNGGGGTGDW